MIDEQRWKAATETNDLIALSSDSSLWPWQPQSRYCLLGKHEGHERLHGLFSELIREACGRCGVILPKSSNLLEMKPMILSEFDAWKNQIHVEAKAEGTALGRAEGKAEGKAEGLADALISLLARRFGAVAPACRTRIQGAGLVTLERWFDRAIDAPDLPSIFDPPR